jgi:hypothetical protein
MLSGMVKKANAKTLLAIAVFACTLAAGPVYAGYLDFTAESLRVEGTDGC